MQKPVHGNSEFDNKSDLQFMKRKGSRQNAEGRRQKGKGKRQNGEGRSFFKLSADILLSKINNQYGGLLREWIEGQSQAEDTQIIRKVKILV